jgi:type I restriction enzyme S subunit
MKNISQPSIRSLKIPLPPLPQQRKIARILTTLDNVITQTEALIAKYQAIKQGLMHDLFTRGVDATGKLRPPQSEAPELYKQSELGWIPKGWELSCVESEFQISTGFTLGTHRRPTKNIRQYLRVANVQRDEIRMDDIAVLEATDEEFQSRKLQVDDLLVVEGHADPNQIGRCARVTAESVGLTFQNHLFRLQSRTIDSRFACEWLNSNVARNYWVCRCATSSGLNTINQTMLKRMPCVVPMHDEQKRISARSDAQKAVIENTRRSLEKFRTLKAGLMQDLLTGKVHVNADELEEIAAHA